MIKDGLKKLEEWTEEEIHNNVIKCIGIDQIHPVSYQVLVQLYAPEDKTEEGLYRADQTLKNEVRATSVGRVLRAGPDAFADPRRFPSGATVTYGEWYFFIPGNRVPFRQNGIELSTIHDDRFLFHVQDPSLLEVVFDPHYEMTGA